MDFLPYKLEWCKQNGLGVHILDNYSKDGSWEYLVKHNVSRERINTNGMFDLLTLQRATVGAINRLKPDWIVYVGLDTFILTHNSLSLEIKKCQGNVLGGRWINIHNTGEVRGNPFKTYFYYGNIKKRIELIYKYHPKARLFGDDLQLRNKKVEPLRGIYVNFGNVKPSNQRNETYIRRKMAWQKGICKGWGTHYPVYKSQNWIWDPKKLKDIRKSEYWELYQKLWLL